MRAGLPVQAPNLHMKSFPNSSYLTSNISHSCNTEFQSVKQPDLVMLPFLLCLLSESLLQLYPPGEQVTEYIMADKTSKDAQRSRYYYIQSYRRFDQTLYACPH